MLKNVTLLPAELNGKTTWRLLGPDGMPQESFGVFADSLIRKHPLNTRRSYCRHLAEFFDYLHEASMALQADDSRIKLTRLMLREIVEAFDQYLVLGDSSGNRVAQLVNATKPSPMHAPATSALMHAPLRKFLALSEQLRKEMAEMAREGLRPSGTVDEAPLLPGMGALETVSGHQRTAMSATSMISGVISGGPRLLRRSILPTVSPQVPYAEDRAFPFDAVANFIDELPAYRDKALYAMLAASGARMSEGLQLLFDDVDVNEGSVALRSPRLRASHPSYLALSPTERERLAWKGRTTESPPCQHDLLHLPPEKSVSNEVGMTIKQQPKESMHAVKSLSDPGASQGARRATEDAPGSAAQDARPGAHSEVVVRAQRRKFSNADKRRILEAADRCTKPGEVGALMRREGVYSSSLSTWRRQRETADLAALAPQKRGPKVDPNRAETLHIAQLTRERDSLKSRLDKALLVIDVQKKLAALLGSPIDSTDSL